MGRTHAWYGLTVPKRSAVALCSEGRRALDGRRLAEGAAERRPQRRDGGAAARAHGREVRRVVGVVDAQHGLVPLLRAERAQPPQPCAHLGLGGELRRRAERPLLVISPLVHELLEDVLDRDRPRDLELGRPRGTLRDQAARGGGGLVRGQHDGQVRPCRLEDGEEREERCGLAHNHRRLEELPGELGVEERARLRPEQQQPLDEQHATARVGAAGCPHRHAGAAADQHVSQHLVVEVCGAAQREGVLPRRHRVARRLLPRLRRGVCVCVGLARVPGPRARVGVQLHGRLQLRRLLPART
mmetsp:Transcript_43014/g.103307  ORF Transcript_43014/g.103307 Transcript_43014/m.103307 type:complete len:300 (-) Transcript_43014:1032-1931(-)